MKLKTISYGEKDSSGNLWIMKKFSFGDINLIVGKNSTGKTRTLNVINSLAGLVSGTKRVTNSDFKCIFDNKGKELRYVLKIEDKKVTKEELLIDGDPLLKRGSDSTGMLKAEGLNAMIKIQIPENELVCVTRRDAIQHPFFEALFKWGRSTRHYLFGTALGQNNWILRTNNQEVINPNPKDTNQVVSFFLDGEERTNGQFSKDIIEDLNSIGFSIKSIETGAFENIRINSSNLEGIVIKEGGHNHPVNQSEISQGFFRALSLVVQLKYSKLIGGPGLILVDDIGEGLDYERSTKLIKVIISLAREIGSQLVMTTNNRFVMNNVPLEYWCVLERQGGTIKSYNYRNSKEKFDEFRTMGLNNFDFLTMDFVNS